MQEPGVVMVAVLVLVCSTQAGKQRGSHSARAAVECRHHLFRTRAPANSVVFINGLIIVLCASRRGRHLLPEGSLSLSPLPSLRRRPACPPRAQGRSLQEANPAIRPVLARPRRLCSPGLDSLGPEPPGQSQRAWAPMEGKGSEKGWRPLDLVRGGREGERRCWAK